MELKNKEEYWKDVLDLLLYLPSWGLTTSPKDSDSFCQLLGSLLYLKKSQVDLSLTFLEKHKLIKITKKKEGINIELTPKGFDVALSNEKHKRELQIQERQEKTNLLLTKATIIVASAALITILLNLLNFVLSKPTSSSMAKVTGLIATFGLFFLIIILTLISGVVLISLLLNQDTLKNIIKS